jgi:hypothetical protein
VAAAFWLSALLAWPLGAQQLDTALIVGTVSDATGAVIPGAQLTFAHLATGTEYSTQTNESGAYRSTPLRIGEYLVVVEAEGFKQYSGTGVSLSIGDIRQLDVQLQVGAVTEVIEVEATAPLLQTQDASQGTVIENRQIVDLPLNGRDYLQLAVIAAGTIPSRGQGVSIGGQRGQEVSFFVDGMDNNSQTIAGQGNQNEAVKPSIDAIQEFRVITNGFNAEYGRTSAGIISVSVKSGTNKIHGSAYEFLRNDAVDARNFFDPSEKPPFKRNQYGFSVGGPAIKNRLFWFGDMEWNDIRESATNVSTVPSLAQRSGDFSVGNQIFDPLTWNGTERQPFANRVIPESRIDPVARFLRDFWPDPQTASATRNFTLTPPRTRDFRTWDWKVDGNIDDKTTAFARWSEQQQDIAHVPELPPSQFGLTSRGAGQDVTSWNSVVGLNRVWTPSLVSSFRYGWTYIHTAVTNPIDEDVNQKIGLNGFDNTVPGTSEINIAGFRAIGNVNFNPNLIKSQTRLLSSDTTWTRGNHAIKFGAQIFWLQSAIVNPQRAKGAMTFDGRFTERSPTNRAGSGQPLADMLLGFPLDMQGSNTVWMDLRAPFQHWYVQDDWKLTPKLTFNIGLRYELNPWWIDRRNQISNFDLGTCFGCNDGFIEVAEEGDSRFDRALMKQDSNNLAPRFGFAYRLTEKTVVRGAYGLFYGDTTSTGGGEFMETNPPMHFKSSLVTGRTDPFLKLETGLPAGTISPTNASGVELSSFDRAPKWPLAQNWNFNIQRNLPGDVLWEIGYYGNKMNHIVGRFDLNAPRPGPGAVNPRRIWTRVQSPGTEALITLGRMNRHEFRFNTLYHGFQTKVEKRYSKGMTFIGSYAWSRTIADMRGANGSGGAQGEDFRFVLDTLDLTRERGVAGQHMAHRFIMSYVYELPFGRGKAYGGDVHPALDAILGNWSVGGIVTLAAGTPQTLTVQGNPANTGGGDRPDVVAGQYPILPAGERTVDRFFNTEAFTPNKAFTIGNAGNNLLIGPRTTAWDFSLYKSIPIIEGHELQFRFEAFNATNTPRFGFPNAQVGNANFGQISSAGTPRNLQFGLKYLF